VNSLDERKALAPWADELPPDWRHCRIDGVADVLFSNVDKHTIEGEESVRLCNYVDVYKNDRISAHLDFMNASAESREIEKFTVRRHDVLATKDSETCDDIAISALVAEDIPGVLCGYHLAMIRPRSRSVVGPYIAWAHASKPFRAQYEAKAVGVTRFGLSQHSFRSACLPLPPRPEQERIAAYLDASCAAIDAAVAAKRRQLETLDALRKSIIQRAVTCGIADNQKLKRINNDWLAEVPVHWKVCRIKRVLEQMDYGIGVSTIEDGRYPVLKMGHLQDGEIRYSKMDFVDEVDDNLILETGDLLFNRTNSPDQVGKAAIFRKSRTDRITFASYLVRLRVDHRANPWFLNYVFNCDGFLGFARRLAIPSVQQSNLNSTRYAQMFIPLPPIEEQESIRAYLDKKTAEVKRIVTTMEFQIDTLNAYRKSLIHECVTGQRRIGEGELQRVLTRKDDLSALETQEVLHA
jgi:type I restriction enzyme S subunit